MPVSGSKDWKPCPSETSIKVAGPSGRDTLVARIVTSEKSETPHYLNSWSENVNRILKSVAKKKGISAVNG
jgi:hypothetical protein